MTDDNFMKIKIKNFFQSATAKRTILGIGAFVILLFVFQAGIFVGYFKASHSLRAGDNFSRTFGERGPGFGGKMMPGFGMMDPTNAHGTTGAIVSVNLPTIIVSDRDGTEKTVTVSDKTDIRKFRNTIKAEDLSVNDFIVVIGAPNEQGDIAAQLIRVMPAPPK
jgi:hypothetical protein